MPGEIEVMAAPIEIFIDPDKALVRTLIQRHDHLPVLRVLGADESRAGTAGRRCACVLEQRHFGSIVLDVQGAPRTAGKEVGRQPDDGMRPLHGNVTVRRLFHRDFIARQVKFIPFDHEHAGIERPERLLVQGGRGGVPVNGSGFGGRGGFGCRTAGQHQCQRQGGGI